MLVKAILSSALALCLVACSSPDAPSQADPVVERADDVADVMPEAALVCGSEVCAAKERCCNDCSGNRFCSLVCPQFDCGPGAQDAGARAEEPPQAATCGGVTCAPGTTCCNPLCGICVGKGMSCPLGCGGGV
jgi:hypothetical protein